MLYSFSSSLCAGQKVIKFVNVLAYKGKAIVKSWNAQDYGSNTSKLIPHSSAPCQFVEIHNMDFPYLCLENLLSLWELYANQTRSKISNKIYDSDWRKRLICDKNNKIIYLRLKIETTNGFEISWLPDSHKRNGKQESSVILYRTHSSTVVKLTKRNTNRLLVANKTK